MSLKEQVKLASFDYNKHNHLSFAHPFIYKIRLENNASNMFSTCNSINAYSLGKIIYPLVKAKKYKNLVPQLYNQVIDLV